MNLNIIPYDREKDGKLSKTVQKLLQVLIQTQGTKWGIKSMVKNKTKNPQFDDYKVHTLPSSAFLQLICKIRAKKITAIHKEQHLEIRR